MVDEKDKRLRLAGEGGEHVHDFLRLSRAVLVVEAGGGRQGVDDDQCERELEVSLKTFGGLVRERLQPLERVLVGEPRHARSLPGERLARLGVGASRDNRGLNSHRDLAFAFSGEPQDAAAALDRFTGEVAADHDRGREIGADEGLGRAVLAADGGEADFGKRVVDQIVRRRRRGVAIPDQGVRLARDALVRRRPRLTHAFR